MKGFSDFDHPSSALHKHTKSQTHVHCYLQLKLYGKQSVDLLVNAEHGNDDTRNNEEVNKNI
jgi:hypothetical protein